MKLRNNLLPATTGEMRPSVGPDAEKPDVEVQEPTVTEKQAIEALERQGLISLPPNILADIDAVGAYVRGPGVMRNQRGRAVINQQRLDSLMRQLTEMLASGEKILADGKKRKLTFPDFLAASKVMGYLSSKLTESQKLMAELQRIGSAGRPIEEPEAPRNGFTPGKAVVPANQTQIYAKEVHMHADAVPKPQ